MRKLVVAAVAVAVFLFTPYFIYTEIVSPFEFGETEMRNAIEGTWTLELATPEGAPRSIKLAIEQARAVQHSARERGSIRSAAACGNRSFTKPPRSSASAGIIRRAEACLDTSDMEVMLTVLGAERPEPLRGTFRVTGTTFERGHLSFTLDEISIGAVLSSKGEVTSVEAFKAGVEFGGVTASLARIGRLPGA